MEPELKRFKGDQYHQQQSQYEHTTAITQQSNSDSSDTLNSAAPACSTSNSEDIESHSHQPSASAPPSKAAMINKSQSNSTAMIRSSTISIIRLLLRQVAFPSNTKLKVNPDVGHIQQYPSISLVSFHSTPPDHTLVPNSLSSLPLDTFCSITSFLCRELPQLRATNRAFYTLLSTESRTWHSAFIEYELKHFKEHHATSYPYFRSMCSLPSHTFTPHLLVDGTSTAGYLKDSTIQDYQVRKKTALVAFYDQYLVPLIDGAHQLRVLIMHNLEIPDEREHEFVSLLTTRLQHLQGLVFERIKLPKSVELAMSTLSQLLILDISQLDITSLPSLLLNLPVLQQLKVQRCLVSDPALAQLQSSYAATDIERFKQRLTEQIEQSIASIMTGRSNYRCSSSLRSLSILSWSGHWRYVSVSVWDVFLLVASRMQILPNFQQLWLVDSSGAIFRPFRLDPVHHTLLPPRTQLFESLHLLSIKRLRIDSLALRKLRADHVEVLSLLHPHLIELRLNAMETFHHWSIDELSSEDEIPYYKDDIKMPCSMRVFFDTICSLKQLRALRITMQGENKYHNVFPPTCERWTVDDDFDLTNQRWSPVVQQIVSSLPNLRAFGFSHLNSSHVQLFTSLSAVDRQRLQYVEALMDDNDQSYTLDELEYLVSYRITRVESEYFNTNASLQRAGFRRFVEYYSSSPINCVNDSKSGYSNGCGSDSHPLSSIEIGRVTAPWSQTFGHR